MIEYNFKSQIATTREQSERLISLGLKKETADMVYHSYGYIIDEFGNKERKFTQPTLRQPQEYESKYAIPAWSLHRLLSMLPDDAPKIYWILDGASIIIDFEDDGSTFFPHKGDIYEGVVNCIEWLIKEGYFNKEYLK